MNHCISGLISLSAIFAVCSVAAAAPGTPVRSWKTDDGWLTELRVHPNGAKFCSTGKASNEPHTFGLSFVRSGPQYMVVLADETEPPAGTSGGDMTFIQGGRTVGVLKVQVEGPTWTSAEPAGPQGPALIAGLSSTPVT